MIPTLVKVYDEPFADSSALPSLLLNKIAKKHVTVALSGDGGDESFLGYNFYDWLSKFRNIVLIPYFLRQALSKFFTLSIFGLKLNSLGRFLASKYVTDFALGVFVGFNSITKKREIDKIRGLYLTKNFERDIYQSISDLNIKLWLENDSNVKVDRASMAFSLEVRSPFLDYRIIEFARTIPIKFRYNRGIRKVILRDILSEYIPEHIFAHPKKGFAVPLAEWIRTDLYSEFTDNLQKDFLINVPNLNVEKFDSLFNLHMKGKHDYSTYIWRVYILSKWYQEFGFYKRQLA
jgi:asparagine synthase (glutamine-hydrolysing)